MYKCCFASILLFFVISCTNRDKIVDKEDIYEDDFRLFQETPVWELAKAVQDQYLIKIKKLVKEEKVDVDFQESKYGNTLLMLAVQNEKYQSCKTLLELGADPNKPNNHSGSSAMIDAASINTTIGSNSKFLKLLLEHGGNPNYIEVGERKKGINTRNTPLIVACGYVDNFTKSPIDKVKVLVEAGADVNYENDLSGFALKEALMMENYDVVLYLLKNGADYTKVIIDRAELTKNGEKLYIVDVLRRDTYPLKSNKYKQKMEIVAFLKKNGVDYRASPIPDFVVENVKKRYPRNWQDYLEKY